MMLKNIPFTVLLCLSGIVFDASICAAGEGANPWGIHSMTVAGGPILSRHFQSGDNNFNERHTIGILKVGTNDRGNWGIYVLTPNSVRKTSIGGGYITDPYVIPIGATQLELTGGLGVVSGYRSYPVPLLSVGARWALYQSGFWNAGLEMAAMPYIAQDSVTNKNKVGIVGTTPFLSIRYSFN